MDRTNENQARLDWALEIACEAGNVTLQHFRQPTLEVERKGDDSPVTIADKAAENLLRERISERFPDDAIIGEEHGQTAGTSGFTWVLDPIDGTKSFIHGIPLYATLIGVLYGDPADASSGTPEVGVIRAPALDEIAYARRGGGAWHQRGSEAPQQAKVAQKTELSDALMLTSEVGSFRKRKSGQGMAAYLELDEKVRLARTWGDAYGYLMVATGQADVMFDPEMNLWDAAALQPVIEEAGGVFNDWQGTPTVHSGEAVAANASLMPAVLESLKGR
ncbi:histidinol-phosphatase [Aeoliella mucimassa]|uniref:Histidinol-phosphatase n=1 Tax=Aeoliella mucimassa TaxID=2527972 RepID=A0A518ANX7_9BACT|nr:histidinol-phosphatase [Aeoliella mucimassa]QDU56424.1 Histidinol-phosphatase [Aeoliella mucimassa]